MAVLEPYLPHLWIGIIAFFLLYYAAVDGAGLGVGMLTLLNPDGDERDIMIGALLSTWHSNQTWLVIVGGMMFGAFPLFYGLVLSAVSDSRPSSWSCDGFSLKSMIRSLASVFRIPNSLTCSLPTGLAATVISAPLSR